LCATGAILHPDRFKSFVHIHLTLVESFLLNSRQRRGGRRPKSSLQGLPPVGVLHDLFSYCFREAKNDVVRRIPLHNLCHLIDFF
jgi:hypothetical protein